MKLPFLPLTIGESSSDRLLEVQRYPEARETLLVDENGVFREKTRLGGRV